jgi:DNA-binding NtrC family response regulator
MIARPIWYTKRILLRQFKEAASMAQVLIVERDDAIRETIRYVLEEAGHTVLEFRSHAEALAFLRRSSSCYVVLFDRGVGNCDPAFVAAIAGDEMLSTRHAYICLTTTPGYLRSAESGVFERLAIPTLTKPFDINDLEEAVRQSALLCRLVPSQETAKPAGTK